MFWPFVSKKAPPSSEESTLIYTHIPKAAGTTLNSIIERNYPAESVYSVDNRAGTAVQDFRTLPSEQKRRIQIIKGHCPFGLHQYIADPVKYFTILRDPVARIISHYNYVLRTPEHYLHKEVSTRNLTLDQYVCSGLSTELDNGQVRILAGCGRTVPFGQCGPAFLEQAKANMAKYFHVVGLAEAFDETLLLLRRAFRWQHLCYTKKNVSERRFEASEVSGPTLDLVRAGNELDMQLYRFASQQFKDRIAAHSSPEEFQTELAEFRKANEAASRAALNPGASCPP